MKLKNLLLTVLTMLPFMCSTAQVRTTEAITIDSIYRPVEMSALERKSAKSATWNTNRKRDNWFITLHGGAAQLMSEQTQKMDFMDQLEPTVGLSVGKWISPTLGFRVNVTAAKMTGFASWNNGLGTGSWYIGDNHPFSSKGGYLPVDNLAYANEIKRRYLDDAYSAGNLDGYTYKVPYVGGTFDLLVNINNFFSPYNPKRFLDVHGYIGTGLAHTFGDKDRDQTHINSIMGKLGLSFNFRLNDAWSLNLDGQSLILPENFDWRVGSGNTMDIVGNYTLGLTYKFKKREFTQAIAYYPEVLEWYPPAVTQQDNCCDDLRACLQRIEELKNKKTGEAPKEKLYIAINFDIDEYDVKNSEFYKLDEISRFMNKYPTSKVSISGYADIKTAYPAYNQKLSERRANEVIRLLTEKYSINKSRLTVNVYGDSIQPFPQNELNRVVIAIDIE